MTAPDGGAPDPTRSYVLVVLTEAAVIAALWWFERVFAR